MTFAFCKLLYRHTHQEVALAMQQPLHVFRPVMTHTQEHVDREYVDRLGWLLVSHHLNSLFSHWLFLIFPNFPTNSFYGVSKTSCFFITFYLLFPHLTGICHSAKEQHFFQTHRLTDHINNFLTFHKNSFLGDQQSSIFSNKKNYDESYGIHSTKMRLA